MITAELGVLLVASNSKKQVPIGAFLTTTLLLCYCYVYIMQLLHFYGIEMIERGVLYVNVPISTLRIFLVFHHHNNSQFLPTPPPPPPMKWYRQLQQLNSLLNELDFTLAIKIRDRQQCIAITIILVIVQYILYNILWKRKHYNIIVILNANNVLTMYCNALSIHITPFFCVGFTIRRWS